MLIMSTLAELQAAGQFKVGQLALLKGSIATGDGGAAQYYWDPSSTETDTSATTGDVIQVTGVTTGRWLLLNGGSTENVTDSTLTAAKLTPNGKTYTINAAAGCAITLPAAVGSGNKVTFIIGTTVTSNTTTIKAASADDEFLGVVMQVDADTGDALVAYPALDADGFDTVTLDGSTTGGILGDKFTFIDMGAGQWQLDGYESGTGTVATPLSATVS
jgi:hypothetical protein